MRSERASIDYSERAAKPRSRRWLRGKLSPFALVALAMLLVFPVGAVWELSDRLDVRCVAGTWFLVCLITWGLYFDDKRKAERGQWRVPEATLHFAEFVGGWPAAFLAQRALRHKIAKPRYQIDFWLIVLLHQWAAFDFLNEWRLVRSGFAWAQRMAAG